VSKRVNCILLIIFCTCKLQAQNIINGSFENNTAISYIWNLTNAQYNATIASSSAIGLSNIGEISLFKTGGGIYYWDTTYVVKAQEGDWFITPGAIGITYIDVNGDTLPGWDYYDAFSLELDDTLIIGSWYTLSFYSKYKTPLGGYPTYLPGRVSVGMSHYPDSFGVVIDTTAFTDTAWTQHSVHFQATSNFRHITCRPVREKIGVNWAFVDNFSLRLDSTGTYIPPPASWNCLATACTDPANGNGTYTTLAACQTACITSAINEQQGEKQLLKIVDVLGKESSSNATGLLFYIYSDGTVEKRIVIE
jgi:hypothetical protein